jgi:hypothetical protein
MPFDYETLRAKAQHTLIDFLHTELQIGPTFAQSALLAESEGHMDHYAQAKGNAIKAAETVRRLIGQVADDAARDEVGMQLAELDRIISTLRPTTDQTYRTHGAKKSLRTN